MLIFLILSIIVFAGLSIVLFIAYKFINAKLDEAMSDIAWGRSMIYDIDYAIFRWFKGDEIDRGKRILAKWEDLCKLTRKINQLVLVSSIILLAILITYLIILIVHLGLYFFIRDILN